MDDFGTGRSNFDRIVALRPDVVKLDRSILVEVMGRSKARGMLTSVVKLLQESGAKIAVEGIESADEALVAMESGADYLQGNYFAAPTAGIGDEGFNSAVLRKLWRMRDRRVAATAGGG
jgi:EAL domain-containing protein (putative c-di-GMP-specific phosphodiesterase class I)